MAKKKTKTKKAKSLKKNPAKKVSQEIVIKVQPMPTPTEKDVLPMKDGGKYMIPRTWLSEKQVVQMVQKTPPQHVYTRPGKGGQRWSYVTGNYVEKVLNFTFGWNWDFEIIAHGKEGDQVWVQGKLTVKDDHGHVITKSQFGRSDIKFLKGTKQMLDYGNDLKSASTDSLKKCASLLGIASDIYGKAEFKAETNVDLDKPALPPPGSKPGPDGDPVLVCQDCDGIVSQAGADFSKRVYGKILCKDCSKNHKPIKK